jgi:hypothetical protein
MDWLDPKTWELPAALAEHWGKIATGAVAVFGLLGYLLARIRWLRAKFRKPQVLTTQAMHEQATPERPLRFVQIDQQSFWGSARSADQAGNQVCGHWNVTNVSDRDIAILNVRLAGHTAQTALVSTENPVPNRFGMQTFARSNFIPAHRMSQGGD